MRCALAIFFVFSGAAAAQNNTISVVSAASYRPVIAPESIAAAFGTNLASTTVSATLDANGQLPVELANTRVEFNGQAAPLIFVSPAQINFVVPAGLAAGTTTLTVRSTDTNTARTAAVQIAASAPALFSSDASGAGPGAILNAVTFNPAPFLTVTPENGPDTRTRLAAYGTGFRNAKNLTARAIAPNGDQFDLAVEFAGGAPGFAGLDQLNFVVPAGLDGAGAVSLTITTDDGVSNTVTFQMNLMPLNLLQLSGITLTPSVVNAGDTFTATIGLNGIARSGGFLVTLRSSNPTAQPPGFITVPQGKASFGIPINTSAVNTAQMGTITAQSAAVTVSANFEIDPQNQVQLSSISVTPTNSLGGRALQATLALTGAAPAGGAIVQVASDNPATRPPGTVTVPFGQSSTSFQIPTVAVSSPQDVTIAATFNRTTVTSKVKVLPSVTLSIDPNPVTGGSTATGSITLADAAPAGGATIALNSTDSVAARVPTLLTIAANQNFGTFNISTGQVNSTRAVTISATYQGIMFSTTLTVNPPPAPTLASLTISPDHITGGQSTQGTVTLAAPAPTGGIRVDLQSSSLIIARVPAFVVVPQGFTAAIFSVDTTRVPVPESAVITASSGGIVRTATVTVQ